MPNTIVREETFVWDSHPRRRILELTCVIAAKTTAVVRDETANPLPLCHLDAAFVDHRIFNTDGGHLVALALGGTNTSDNVVPMYAGFNRTQWRDVERQIDGLDARTMGKRQMRIVMHYDGADPRIPTSFEVQVHREGGGQLIHDFGRIAHTPPALLADESTRADIRRMRTAITQSRGFTARGFAEAQGHHLVVPDVPGPYAFLDYLLFVEGSLPGITVGNGLPFSLEQRQLMLLYNPPIHGTATVVSDDPADPNRQLTDFGDSGAEVDHIVAKRRNGSNAFSNARLVSSAWNKAKSDSHLASAAAAAAGGGGGT